MRMLGEWAISVGMVKNIRGLNLPRPEMTTRPRLHRNQKAWGRQNQRRQRSKSPRFQIRKPSRCRTRRKNPRGRSDLLQKAPPQIAQNAPPKEVVPFGEGGTPGFTYSQFSAAGGSGGIGVGDGMFGSKYGWYVRQIRDIVSANWQRSMVDANVRSAPRAYIYFEIQRDGSVANESVKESSGVPSLDRSGLRAIRASRFPPLPGGETRLTVEFYFEYSR